jgi:hypothetical protein
MALFFLHRQCQHYYESGHTSEVRAERNFRRNRGEAPTTVLGKNCQAPACAILALDGRLLAGQSCGPGPQGDDRGIRAAAEEGFHADPPTSHRPVLDAARRAEEGLGTGAAARFDTARFRQWRLRKQLGQKAAGIGERYSQSHITQIGPDAAARPRACSNSFV